MRRYILYGKPIELRPLVSHIIGVGKSGSGKSNAMESYVTGIFDKYNKGERGIKLIDIFDNGRFENAMYTYAEDNPELVSKLRNLKREPKAYPLQYIVICGNNLRYKKELPKNFILGSFDITSLRLNDIFFLFSTSDKSKEILTNIAWRYGDVSLNELMSILYNYPVYGALKATKISLLNRITNLRYSGIFSEKAHKIDFHDILQDYKKITSFSTVLVEKDYEGIVYGLILKQIFELKRINPEYPPIKVYYRELANVLGRTSEEQYQMVRKQIENILREGRDYGLDFVGDTQRVLDLDTWARTQFGLAIQLRSDYADAEKFLQFLGEIPKKYLLKIPNLEVGTALVCIGGEWHYPVMFSPAPSRHKRARTKAFDFLKEREGTTIYDPDEYLPQPKKMAIEEDEEEKPKRQVFKHKCSKCGYEWEGYKENPKLCPNPSCRTSKWK